MANITVNASILLPPDLAWEDEFDWTPVQSSEEVSLSGATIIQEQSRLSGRRITLASGDDRACISRTALQALCDLRDSMPEDPFTLLLGDARSFSVYFDNGANAISARPVQPGKNPAATDLFVVTLRFLEA